MKTELTLNHPYWKKKKKAADSAEKDYRNFLKTYSVKKNILIKI